MDGISHPKYNSSQSEKDIGSQEDFMGNKKKKACGKSIQEKRHMAMSVKIKSK